MHLMFNFEIFLETERIITIHPILYSLQVYFPLDSPELHCSQIKLYSVGLLQPLKPGDI